MSIFFVEKITGKAKSYMKRQALDRREVAINRRRGEGGGAHFVFWLRRLLLGLPCPPAPSSSSATFIRSGKLRPEGGAQTLYREDEGREKRRGYLTMVEQYPGNSEEFEGSEKTPAKNTVQLYSSSAALFTGGVE